MAHVVVPGRDEVQVREGRPHWDLSAHVRQALAARPSARRILLVLSARNCHGCEMLAEQLETLSGTLSETAVCKAMGGDFLAGDHVRDVVLGRLTLSAPGVPLGVLFDVDGPERLSFRSLLLGPLSEPDPAMRLAGLLSGRSQWVQEAAGARIRACAGPICFFLDEGNQFSAPFSAFIPEVHAA